MEEQIVDYWKNKLEQEDICELKVNDYILHFAIINQKDNIGINKWFNFDSKNKLIGFIKYVAMPSIQISRAVANNEGNVGVHIDAIGYFDAVELLEVTNVKVKHIEEFENWFEGFKDYNEETDIKEIKSYIENINKAFDYRSEFLLSLDVYENIKSVGLELIKLYEEDGMIDVLEDQFNFSKEEIESIFNNVNKNIFLFKRIMSILNNSNIIK